MDKVERAWASIRAMQPIIEEHRAEGERLRRLPDAIARAFIDANVFRLLLPPEFGGEDIDPLTFYDLVEELSSYDGSVGWNYSIGITGSLTFCALPRDQFRHIYATADSCVAGSASPPGRAVATANGYLLTGRWAVRLGDHSFGVTLFSSAECDRSITKWLCFGIFIGESISLLLLLMTSINFTV